MEDVSIVSRRERVFSPHRSCRPKTYRNTYLEIVNQRRQTCALKRCCKTSNFCKIGLDSACGERDWMVIEDTEAV